MDTLAPSRKDQRYTLNNISKTAWAVRFVMRMFIRILVPIFTRTKIEGLDNIPKEGGALIVANHSSVFDGLYYFGYLPFSTQVVGPGDFRLKFPNRIAFEWTDVIMIKRGESDTQSLRAMLDTLKSGGLLALFPEGGTWEKKLYEVKDGAAYMSMNAQVPIVPIAISGAYDIWRDVWTFKRPQITVRVLPPMDPVPKVRRQERKAVLEDATNEMMYRIYQNLTEEELERYKMYMRQNFHGQFVATSTTDAFDGAMDYPLLAELVSKKNLFSTFHEHLALPMAPFLHRNRFYSAADVKKAVDALHHANVEEVPNYIPYRLSEEAKDQLLAELEDISARLTKAPTTLNFKFVVEEEIIAKEISIEKPVLHELEAAS